MQKRRCNFFNRTDQKMRLDLTAEYRYRFDGRWSYFWLHPGHTWGHAAMEKGSIDVDGGILNKATQSNDSNH